MNPSWWARIAILLLVLGLLLLPSQSLQAQGVGTGEAPSAGAAVDDESFVWPADESSADKAGNVVPNPDDEQKATQQQHFIYLPALQTSSPNAGEAVDGYWYTVLFEGFEGIWPAGSWVVSDYNGSGVGGTARWDDTNTGRYSGYWSAHPNDGALPPNNTDTFMRAGPLNLAGATSARLTFVYWLNSEANFDFFSWEYSCNGTTNWHGGQARSGRPGSWLSVTESLNKCLGYTNVYIKFTYKTDYSVSNAGVWVDNVRVQKWIP